MTHNKNRVILLYLPINCISACYEPDMLLPLKDEYTLYFSNFLIIGSCHSPANWRFSESEFQVVPVSV